MPDRTAGRWVVGLLVVSVLCIVANGCGRDAPSPSGPSSSDPNVSAEEDGEDAMYAKSKKASPNRPQRRRAPRAGGGR